MASWKYQRFNDWTFNLVTTYINLSLVLVQLRRFAHHVRQVSLADLKLVLLCFHEQIVFLSSLEIRLHGLAGLLLLDDRAGIESFRTRCGTIIHLKTSVKSLGLLKFWDLFLWAATCLPGSLALGPASTAFARLSVNSACRKILLFTSWRLTTEASLQIFLNFSWPLSCFHSHKVSLRLFKFIFL